MAVPAIPVKFRGQRLVGVNKKSTEDLFVFFVRQLYFTGRYSESFTFLQYSQMIFKEKNSDLMRRVQHEYKNYFSRGMKRYLLLEKVYEEHPHIWGEEDKKPDTFSVNELTEAIDDEIREVYRSSKGQYLTVRGIDSIGKRNKLYLYKATIITTSDEFTELDEGATVTLTAPNDTKHRITILMYDKRNDSVAFQSSKELTFINGKIKVANVSVLFSLKDSLEGVVLEGLTQKLLKGEIPSTIPFGSAIYGAGLSKVQKDCVLKALENNVTFIWGPPGTGKSFTLSKLLVNLYREGEKTLVTSTANVAVDGLLEKTADVLDEIYKKQRTDIASERKILRIGYSQSDRIRDKELFQVTNDRIEDLNYKLQLVNERVHSLVDKGVSEAAVKLRSERDEIKQKLDDENKKALDNAKLIFTTSAKFISDNALKSFEFDNLVIDEGSMMSLPYLLVLASKVKKRIIITGDFMQLGPIAMSRSKRAEQWLKKDLFQLLGNRVEDITIHKALFMLNEQRRMAAPIAQLINKPFYQGKLVTLQNVGQLMALDLPPNRGHIHFIETPNTEENKAEVARSKSKYNKYSRKVVHELIRSILSRNGSSIRSIGVISPYKQQIVDYKNEGEAYVQSKVDVQFGTIHTFQGSECDIIIWDMVDTLAAPIGSLYKGKEGERLINVALSRAKSKLVVVGQRRLFNEGQGRELIHPSIKRIVRKIADSDLTRSEF